MSEGTEQHTVELDEGADPDPLAGDDLGETGTEYSAQTQAGASAAESSQGDDSSVLSGVISPLSLALVLVPPFLCAFLVGTLPLLPAAVTTVTGAAVGLFGGGFLAGLVRAANEYTEAALGGAIVGLLTAWTTNNGFEFPVVAVGLVAGIVLALAGTYFGSDLRTGLTKEI